MFKWLENWIEKIVIKVLSERYKSKIADVVGKTACDIIHDAFCDGSSIEYATQFYSGDYMEKLRCSIRAQLLHAVSKSCGKKLDDRYAGMVDEIVSRYKTEEFLDSVIDRINRKQVK